MSRRRWATLLLAVTTYALGGDPSEHQITIRLLEPSGTPITHQTLSVQFRIAKGAELQELEVITGADGVAKVPLSNAIPPKMSIGPKYTEDLYPCCPLSLFEAGKIITTGVVARCSKGTPGCRCKFSKRAVGLSSSPGELILFYRAPTLLERLGRNVWE
jgi:hypothetical protein